METKSSDSINRIVILEFTVGLALVILGLVSIENIFLGDLNHFSTSVISAGVILLVPSSLALTKVDTLNKALGVVLTFSSLLCLFLSAKKLGVFHPVDVVIWIYVAIDVFFLLWIEMTIRALNKRTPRWLIMILQFAIVVAIAVPFAGWTNAFVAAGVADPLTFFGTFRGPLQPKERQEGGS